MTKGHSLRNFMELHGTSNTHTHTPFHIHLSSYNSKLSFSIHRERPIGQVDLTIACCGRIFTESTGATCNAAAMQLNPLSHCCSQTLQIVCQ
jgi:hypothetical protein